MENQIFELQYALDTFYFLICGALVMWMAAGFAMLEAGLVRAKNTTEILTKNVALFAIACTMYFICGYAIMYGGDFFLSTITADGVQGESKPATYAPSADFFFQVVFVATAMSIVSGAVAERMKLWAFFIFAVVMTGFIYPMEGAWTWGEGVEGSLGENGVFGWYKLSDYGWSDFAGSGIVHRVLSCSVRVKVGMALTVKSMRSLVRICHWPRWVRLFFGWVGLVLMVALCLRRRLLRVLTL